MVTPISSNLTTPAQPISAPPLSETDQKILQFKERYLSLAAKKDPKALNSVGCFHYLGLHGFEKSVEKSFNYIREAAQLGSAQALYNWGLQLHQIPLITRLPGGELKYTDARTLGELTLEKYEKAGQAGYAKGFYRAGRLFFSGFAELKQDRKKAFSFFQQGAKLKDSSCNFMLGLCCKNGWGTEKKELLAKEYFFQAAKARHPEALYQIGLALFTGTLGFPLDQEEAFSYFKEAAELQVPEAMINVGVYYEKGLGGVQQSGRHAIEWYNKAAAADYSKAYYYLGNLYFKGCHEIACNPAEAINFYLKGRDPKCCYKLALCYEKGYGTAIDISKAKSYYQSAASDHYELEGLIRFKKAVPKAVFKIGLYEKDKKKGHNALSYFERAAAGGFNKAYYEIGMLYFKGCGDLPKNEQEAFKYFEIGASKKELSCIFRLARCHEEGKGTKVDLPLAKKLYLELADTKHSEALQKIAGNYYYGTCGFPKDYVKALEYTRKAVELGNPASMYCMGIFYEDGKGGVKQNGKKALEWYTKAQEAGHAEAYAAAGLLYFKGHRDIPKDQVKAFALYQNGANKRNITSTARLAACYYDGHGTGVDKNRALHYWLRAAKWGDTISMINIGIMHEIGECGLEKSNRKALEWFEKADKAGDKNAPEAISRVKAKLAKGKDK